jgi:SAM-dependent methyltransferase
MTADWSDGYVVDVPYIEPLTPELCPARLSMAAVLHNQPPIPDSHTIQWIDVGSGSGLSACMVAAANPRISVWGFDFNPTHVERAREIANGAALDNCTFVEASFAAVASDRDLGPSDADVIVVHGVHSWVSPVNQRQITEIIRQRLRPGGLAYVMYETATGWSSMVPIAEALRLHAIADGRRSDHAFEEAARDVLRLAEARARYFPIGDPESLQFQLLTERNSSYAAHEYLGSHFRPVMFDELATIMDSKACVYAGSVDASDHIAGVWSPPELTDLLAHTTDLLLRQMLQDLVVQRQLRQDLYRRGLAAPTPDAQRKWMRHLAVVGLGKEYVDGSALTLPIGQVRVDDEFYRPLVDRLTETTLSLADIEAERSGMTLGDAATALGFLVEAGFAAPLVNGWETGSAVSSARRLNELLIAENLRGGDHRALVAPATGAAIESEYVEMLTLGALWSGTPDDVGAITSHVLEQLTRQERLVRENGVLIENVEEARIVVERRVRRALDRAQGAFVQLGIC